MSMGMSGGAYNEHIFSIYSAYIEHILQVRGRIEERAGKEGYAAEYRLKQNTATLRFRHAAVRGCNAAGQRRALNDCTTIRRWKRRTQNTC